MSASIFHARLEAMQSMIYFNGTSRSAVWLTKNALSVKSSKLSLAGRHKRPQYAKSDGERMLISTTNISLLCVRNDHVMCRARCC